MNNQPKLMSIICILLIFGIILQSIFIVGFINAKRDKEYNQNIKRANSKITELEGKIEINAEASRLKEKKAKEDTARANKIISDMKEDERIREKRYARELAERDARIATMSPDEVVTETRAELGRQDIYKLPDGVKFSIEASRANLAILSRFSLVRDDRDKIKVNLDNCLLAAKDYDKSVLGFKGVIVSKNEIIFDMGEIITEERGKFSLCEKDKKQKWLDGLVKGSLGMLAVIVFFKLIGGK